MAEAVKTKRKTRGGHKAYVSQVLPEAQVFIEKFESIAETRLRIAQLKASHEEQLEILSDLVELEGVSVEEIAENIKGEIKAIITTLAELLTA